MKTLEQFISEYVSLNAAAKALGRPQPTVFCWIKSGKQHYVVSVNGTLTVLGVK